MAALQKLADAGAHAGTDIDEGSKKAKGGIDLLHGAIGDITSMITGLATVGTAISTVSQVFTVINQQAREGAEWIHKQVEGFTALREAMRQIQSIQGLQPTTEEAVKLIKRAEEAKLLTPTEEMAGEKAVMQYASPYMITAANPKGKFTKETFEKMMPGILAVAKQKDISTEVAGRALQPIFGNMPAGTSAEKYQEIFMGLASVGEASSGSAESTLAQFGEHAQAYVGEEGAYGPGQAGLEGAMRGIAVQQLAHPGRGAEYQRDLVMALTLMRTGKPPKGAEFDLKPTDTPEQSLAKIRKGWIAAGRPKITDYLRTRMGGHGGIYSTEAAMTGITKGIEDSQYEAMATSFREHPTLEKSRADAMKEEAFQDMEAKTGTVRDSMLIAAEPENVQWEAAKTLAERHLAKERRMLPENKTWGDTQKGFVEGMSSILGGGKYQSWKDVTIRQRALAELAQKYLDIGGEQAKQELEGGSIVHWTQQGANVTASVSMVSEAEARVESVKLLRKIAEHTKTVKPLSAPATDPAQRP